MSQPVKRESKNRVRDYKPTQSASSEYTSNHAEKYEGKRKGYQEARRQDKDRRDRRNERLSKSDQSILDSKIQVEPILHSKRSVSRKTNYHRENPTVSETDDDKHSISKGESNFSSHFTHSDFDFNAPVMVQHSDIENEMLEASAKVNKNTVTESDKSTDLLKILNNQTETGGKERETKKEPIQTVKVKGMSAAELEKQWQMEEVQKNSQNPDEREVSKANKHGIKIINDKKGDRQDNKKKERNDDKHKEKKGDSKEGNKSDNSSEEKKDIKKDEQKNVKVEKQEELVEVVGTKEELIKQSLGEKKMLEEYISGVQDSIKQKKTMREKNLPASENYPDESYFTKLDSSLKKNTAFVKKIKNLTESQRATLIKDFNGLNLTKYIGEVASSLTETKLKMSDIGCALEVCSLIHQRYSEFSQAFLENWQKVLLSKKDDKVPNPSKLRVDLRFFADLITCGIFTSKEGLPILANQLMLLTTNDKEEHNNLSILISFCKYCGEDYAGVLPRKYRVLEEKHNIMIPRSNILPEERKKGCCKLLKEYYSSACTHLLNIHKDRKQVEKQNRKIIQTKGELSEERKESQEKLSQSFDKFLQNVSTFADLLDEDLPDIPIEKIEVEEDIMGIDIYCHENESNIDIDGGLFEDEDTRQFYEHLPDLKAVVPQILYKDSEQLTREDKDAEEEDTTQDDELDVETLEKEMEKGDKSLDALGDEDVQAPEIEEDDFDIAASMRQILDAFLNGLPNCVNRDLIDKAAIDFCMNLNTKANRKKLVKTLFTVHRTRYDLLPFYSRLVATLHPCMPDVAADLVHLLKGDFKWHVRKKDQINIESKLKTVRFIGELTKFTMFPKNEVLHCLKMLLFDFTHHNIEMGCTLLEICGRFLFKSPDSHHRTKVYLDVMMRKKTALHFDQRYSTLIENAFYYCNPPENKEVLHLKRPAFQEYVRKLLYKDLSKITTEKILRQIRKFNWDDPEVVAYVTSSLTAVWNVRYNVIHCCANLLAGLACYHENVAVSVVDGIIEDIRLGLEINHPKFNQRRISSVKYLGELYNYRLVESAVIFKCLYLFITFGVSLNEAEPTILDPPEHLFRIRLVCTLLDTCGQYFDRGSSKKKLDCFLVYFERYYWFKKSQATWNADRPFPLDIQYSYHEALELLRPKLKLQSSLNEAITAVEELEKEFKERLVGILPDSDQNNEYSGNESKDYFLGTIQESEEVDQNEENYIPSQSQSLDSEDELHSQQKSLGDQVVDIEIGGESYEAEESNKEASDDAKVCLSDEDECVNILSGGPKVIKCTEDEDFLSSFDKMLTENIQNRMQDSPKVPTLDIAVPMHIKSQKAKYYVPGEEEEVTEDRGLKFVLMTKRGNKQQFSNLNIPISEKFATEYKEREQAERLEKEKMKRVVLNIHERQEEEDYQELMASLNRPIGPPMMKREHRQKPYQHQKGAPDADAIFGSKK